MGSLDEVLTGFCGGGCKFVFEPYDLSVHGPGVWATPTSGGGLGFRVCRQG